MSIIIHSHSIWNCAKLWFHFFWASSCSYVLLQYYRFFRKLCQHNPIINSMYLYLRAIYKLRVCQQPIIDHRYLLSSSNVNSIDQLSTTTQVHVLDKTLFNYKSHHNVEFDKTSLPHTSNFMTSKNHNSMWKQAFTFKFSPVVLWGYRKIQWNF